MKHLNTLLTIALLAATSLALPASAAEVYKCVNSDGKVSYSSQPCPKDAAAEKLRLQKAPTVQDDETTGELSGWDARIAAETDPEQKKRLEILKQQCELAETQLKKYEAAPYLVTRSDDGSEKKLSKEEGEAEKQKLRDFMTRECK